MQRVMQEGLTHRASRSFPGWSLALIVILGLAFATPASAAPGITASVGPPDSTRFGDRANFTINVTNTGTTAADAFTSFSVENFGSTGLTSFSAGSGPALGPGQSTTVAVQATVTGAPGSNAQLGVRVTGVTASGTVADPQTTATGSAFTVTDAVVMSVAAERKQGSSYSPCVGGCSATIQDGLRFSIVIENRSEVSATVGLSAPVPPRTSNVASSNIPATTFTIAPNSTQVFVREVTVDDPPDDSSSPQPGDIIVFSPSATYSAVAGATTVSSRSVEGSPAAVFTTVIGPRLGISHDLDDLDGGAPVTGDVVASSVEVSGNTGNTDATGVVVTVDLTDIQAPTNVRINGELAGVRATVTEEQLIVRIGSGASGSSGGTLAPGSGAVNLTFNAVISPGSAQPRSVASLTFGGGGLSPRTAEAGLEARADLDVNLAGVPADALQGSSFLAEASLTNFGPAPTDPAAPPTLTISYDANMLTATTPTGCDADPGIIRCSAATSLEPSQGYTVPITFTTLRGGVSLISVSATGPQPDPVPGNNGDGATLTILATGTPPPPPPDTTAPQTRITRATISSARRKATFRFSATESNATFRCKLDSKPLRRCNSPKIFRNLRPGRHKFTVQATDSSGNVDRTPALKRFRIQRR